MIESLHHLATLALARVAANNATQLPPFSFEAIRSRDVIIITPYRAEVDPDTGEDSNHHILADQLAELALNQGCRVTVIPVAMRTCGSDAQAHRNLSLLGEAHDIHHIHRPVFMVAPATAMPQEDLKHQIDLLCDAHQFSREELVLVESIGMDAHFRQTEPHLISTLQASGFRHIATHNVDAGETTNPCRLVEQASTSRSRTDVNPWLLNLLDGFNVSVSENTNYQLEFIDSSNRHFSMPDFLQQLLTNTPDMTKNSCYIIVWPQLKQFPRERLPQMMPNLLGIPKRLPEDPAHFSRLQIGSTDKFTPYVQPLVDITGNGQRKINIVFIDCQREEILLSTKDLAQAGMRVPLPASSLRLAMPARVPRHDETAV